mgnify:CR=1 FL=1
MTRADKPLAHAVSAISSIGVTTTSPPATCRVFFRTSA